MAQSLLTAYFSLSADTQSLLRVLAWMAPQPFPASLLGTSPDSENPSPKTNPAISLTELEAAGFLKWDTEKTAFTVSASLLNTARCDLDPDENPPTALLSALHCLARALPPNPTDTRHWPTWQSLAPHLTSAARHGYDYRILEPTCHLLNQTGLFLKASARFAEAEPLFRNALVLAELLFDKAPDALSTALNNFAQLLQETNRLAEAEPLMVRALAIDEASFGEEHPDVAIRLNNLAHLLKATNRLAEAEPLYRRALAIDEASFGKDHPDVARHLSNLAALLQDTKRLAEAEPLMRRALAIDEASFAKDHPNVAIRLNNLAHLLKATNRLAEAEPLLVRALGINEASFGKDHPRVAIQLNNLAHLLQATNRLAEAEPLMVRALVIDEASFGQDHPKIAIRLNNLASLYYSTNRMAEAEPLMRRAVGINYLSQAQTGHRNSSSLLHTQNYLILCREMQVTDGEIHTRLEEERVKAGLEEGAFEEIWKEVVEKLRKEAENR